MLLGTYIFFPYMYFSTILKEVKKQCGVNNSITIEGQLYVEKYFKIHEKTYYRMFG